MTSVLCASDPGSSRQPTPGARVLVVEDEPKIAGALREGLEGEGYRVVVESTGEGAFFRLTSEHDQFDAILLALTLPGRDGLEVLAELRRQHIETPVVVLTARDALEDRVIGLDAGAVWQSGFGSLQGRWVVTAGEHNGLPMDGLNGGVMTVDGNSVDIETASGNVLTGTLEADLSMRPPHLDLLHADGTRWEAVFDVDGATFRLNYVATGGLDPRPTGFTTLPTNEESLVVLQRAPGATP
jgi:uncharacterized protein (TIGR03067 family)